MHGDFKVNNQKSFPLRSLKLESALETIKAPIRAETHAPSPRPPTTMEISLLVLEKEPDGVSLSPGFRKLEVHLSQIKEDLRNKQQFNYGM